MGTGGSMYGRGRFLFRESTLRAGARSCGGCCGGAAKRFRPLEQFSGEQLINGLHL